MTGPQIDYAAVYRQLPIPVVLLTPEFAIADVNLASEQATGRTRDDLLGRDVFDAFPSNPSDPAATTISNTLASPRRVLATGEPNAMEFQKSDIEVPGSPGLFARLLLERGKRAGPRPGRPRGADRDHGGGCHRPSAQVHVSTGIGRDARRLWIAATGGGGLAVRAAALL